LLAASPLQELKPIAKSFKDVLSQKDVGNDVIQTFGLDKGAKRVKKLGEKRN